MHDTSRRNFIGSSLALLVASFAGAAGLLKLPPAKPRAASGVPTKGERWTHVFHFKGRHDDDVMFPPTLTTCDLQSVHRLRVP